MRTNSLNRFIATAILAVVCSYASAQISLNGILNKVQQHIGADTTTVQNTKSNGQLGEVIGGLLEGLASGGQVDVVGNWIYDKPVVILSSGNLLKKAGGSLASSVMEKKLQEVLDKYGMKKEQFKVTFNSDSTFVQTLSGKQLKGTFSVNDNNVALKYGGSLSQFIGKTQIDNGYLIIVMDVSKLLEYADEVGEMSKNVTIKSAAAFLGSMDSMECGLRFRRE